MKNIAKQMMKKKEFMDREFYSLRSLLGHSWALFYLMLGGREAGKSYACTEFFVRQWKTKGRPFYWLRLTDKSQQKLLQNNAEKLIDPDIRRKYNLDLFVNGDGVYEVIKRAESDEKGKQGKIIEKRLMARVLALSTFYNDKGSGLFDKDFLNDPNMYYNIALDEMNREKNEKRSFDIVYAFANQLENLVRSTKTRVRVICIGNTLEEASDILCSFNFIPEKFGRYKLRSKRCIIDYIEPTDAYKKRRSGSVADILMGDHSTFTNEITVDKSLVSKKRLIKPSLIIKFTQNKDEWFTLWDNNVIARYNGEIRKTKGDVEIKSNIVPMRPYIDESFTTERRDAIILLFDSRSFLYHNLITFKLFQKNLELLKPRK